MTTNTTTASQPNAAPSNNVLREALERIARWHGEFPETGKTWPDGTPTSYGAEYGSNGQRDYMRQVAIDALAAAPALPEPAAAQERNSQPTALDALRAIVADTAATYKAIAEHGGPVVSIGQFGRLSRSERLLAAAPQPLAEVSAAQAVPEGWQLVPIEPTDEMRLACPCHEYFSDIDKDWAAMLAADPSQPTDTTREA